MKKGIIMQIDDAYLTLLTPEGEFLRARKLNQPYSIGEEIHFFPAGDASVFKSVWTVKNFMKRPAWIVAFALFIFLGSFIPMNHDSKAYAYMSIDGNPSLELGINKKMQVVELTAFNKEGKKVISQLMNWKDEDVSKLTETILNKIEKDGFLKDNKHIIISTVRTNQPDKEVEKKLLGNIKKIEASVNAQHLQLTLLSGTEKDLQKAHKLGITAGKYQSATTQKAKAAGENPPEQNHEVKKDVVPAKQAITVPPGQLKKQPGNSSINESNSNVRKIQPENKNQWKGHFVPPGQFKKMDDHQINENRGQAKKQSQHAEKSNSKSKHNENKEENHHNHHKKN
jgi:hypothetical protein